MPSLLDRAITNAILVGQGNIWFPFWTGLRLMDRAIINVFLLRKAMTIMPLPLGRTVAPLSSSLTV